MSAFVMYASHGATVQVPLPQPRNPCEMDLRKNDFEIFQKYILPNGGVTALGDLWDDVPRTKQFAKVN